MNPLTAPQRKAFALSAALFALTIAAAATSTVAAPSAHTGPPSPGSLADAGHPQQDDEDDAATEPLSPGRSGNCNGSYCPCRPHEAVEPKDRLLYVLDNGTAVTVRRGDLATTTCNPSGTEIVYDLGQTLFVADGVNLGRANHLIENGDLDCVKACTLTGDAATAGADFTIVHVRQFPETPWHFGADQSFVADDA